MRQKHLLPPISSTLLAYAPFRRWLLHLVFACLFFLGQRVLPLHAALASAVCTQLVLRRGYPCQDVVVETKDGWRLGLQHIAHGRNGALQGSTVRPPVLLQHGLLQGSDTWLLNDAGNALALVLADRGYDVWLGNTRGSRWSHGHKTWKPTEKRYWDWSFDELAEYDLPAIIMHVATHSTAGQLFYVGHSQGTILAFASFEKSEVSAHVRAAALLSPIVHLKHIRSPFVRAAAEVYLDRVAKVLGFGEFNVRSVLGQALVGEVCDRHGVDCSNLLAAVTGPNCCINMSRASEDLRWTPDSTSIKNIQHFAQMVRGGEFQHFDYGWVGNLRRYGRMRPPRYPLNAFRADLPLLLVGGGADALGDPQDVAELIPLLRPLQPQHMCLERYAHVDFVLSYSATHDLYNHVDQFFQGVGSIKTSTNAAAAL